MLSWRPEMYGLEGHEKRWLRYGSRGVVDCLLHLVCKQLPKEALGPLVPFKGRSITGRPRRNIDILRRVW